jgi:hypothetical protein
MEFEDWEEIGAKVCSDALQVHSVDKVSHTCIWWIKDTILNIDQELIQATHI